MRFASIVPAIEQSDPIQIRIHGRTQPAPHPGATRNSTRGLAAAKRSAATAMPTRLRGWSSTRFAASLLARVTNRKKLLGGPVNRIYSESGPCLGEDDDCRQLIADLWKRSSEQMRAVAESAGASYLHVLQPNQYVADSKTLTDEELTIAWAPQRPWSRAAAAGYPFLRLAEHDLVTEGKAFFDLSNVFRDHPETIYDDLCCHYNDRGYEILGQTYRTPRRTEPFRA